MTVEEIFGQIGQHMVEGLMVHTQLSDYFEFLGLKGYHKCHEYHYFDESRNFRKMSSYYLKHYNKIITNSHVANPQVIPDSWYKYSRQQVDTATRKTGIVNGFEKWINWETETLKLYQSLHKELVDLNEVAAALELEEYIKDVSEELSVASQKLLELKIVDFNLSNIIDEQSAIYEKYSKKIKVITL